MQHLTFWIGAFVMTALLPAQDADVIELRRPNDVDDATWRRLKEGFAREKAQFMQLLAELDKHRIDYTRDSMAEIVKKRSEIRALLDKHTDEAVGGLADPDLIALNAVHFRNEAAPRLSGRVIKVGPDADCKTLEDAHGRLKAGDLMVLSEGDHQFHWPMKIAVRSEGEEPRDLAIVGQGPKKTQLRIQLPACRRLRIEGVTIDCQNNEFVYMRGGGSIHLKNCTITNYNSGAGGSNAIYGVETVMLIEDCIFEGGPGRASGHSGGDAFDLRGDNLLFVRATRFEGNDEVLRAGFPCTFDACESTEGDRESGIILYDGGRVYARKNKLKSRDSGKFAGFEFATDDQEFISFAMGERTKVDDRTRRLAEGLQIERNLPFWIGLLRHPQASIRRKAAGRVESLTGKTLETAREPKAIDEKGLDEAIRRLDDDRVETRDQAEASLVGAGEKARPAVEAISRTGTAEQKARAARILAALDAGPLMGAEIECGKLLNWFDEHRARLIWNESSKQYELKP